MRNTEQFLRWLDSTVVQIWGSLAGGFLEEMIAILYDGEIGKINDSYEHAIEAAEWEGEPRGAEGSRGKPREAEGRRGKTREDEGRRGKRRTSRREKDEGRAEKGKNILNGAERKEWSDRGARNIFLSGNLGNGKKFCKMKVLFTIALPIICTNNMQDVLVRCVWGIT